MAETTTGYSGKPLIQKLGIKEGTDVVFINPPEIVKEILQDIKFSINVKERLAGTFDYIHLFTKSKTELKKKFPQMKEHLERKGMIWISWPKKSSGVLTDLNENIIRDTGLPLGLVDIKVAAIDETWSGLKFTFRKS